MSKIEEYSFSSMIATKDGVDFLHIEVRSLKFSDETYSKHYRFQEMPTSIRLVFRNLAQVFTFLQRREMIYFDEEEQALKICLAIAGEIKEFPIPLDICNKWQVLRQKIEAYQQEKAKVSHDFSMMKIEKDESLEALKKELEALKAEKAKKQAQIAEINNRSLQFDAVIQDLKKECEVKMARLRQLVPNESQLKFGSVNDYKRHEERKKFWVDEIGKLKKDKFQELKLYINKRINFEEKTSLAINNLKLTKMLFVEIFINLEILDLSNNAIVSIEGLQPLRQLMKLKLSQNRIAAIPPLPKLQRLLELILNSNCIKKLENVFHLPALQILNLSLNQIQSIPDEISKLHRLVELRLFQNQIGSISEKVLLLKNIKVFSVMRNKCYGEGSKSREIINKMLKNGVKTAIEEIEEINILE